MPTSGGAWIPITASRKQISREIKQLMGNGGRQAALLMACEAGTGKTAWERKVLTTGLVFGAQCIVGGVTVDWVSCQ